MKIGIIGYGKMGRAIKQVALDRKHSVVIIDRSASEADFKEINTESLDGVDVCIEFTHPNSVIPNLEKLIKLNQKVVVGTTGWHEQADKINDLVKNSQSALLHSYNFSIGVNIFFKIIQSAAKLINKFEQFDISGLEFHHNQKADSPSGTARILAEILLKELDRKNKVEYNIVDRKIHSDELHFASVRCGNIPGTHEVIMDSQADTISLKHTARNRDGWALGSVIAAEWLQEKKGMFTFDDCIKNLLG